jgi:hypothetical protein
LLTVVVVLVVIGILLFVWRKARRAGRQATEEGKSSESAQREEPVEM